MKKTISIFLVFAFTLTSYIFAQDNPNAPKFEFLQKQHSFGEIEEGPSISYDFEFTNIGKEPLIITNVKASCGCTTPYWPKDPIMPGKKAKITATYNTKGRPGNFNKSITVTSNAGTEVLYINGIVTKPVEFSFEREKSILEE